MFMDAADITLGINSTPDDFSCTEAEVQAVLDAGLQPNTILNEIAPTTHVSVWDRVSPVGSAPAAHFFTNRSEEFGRATDDYRPLSSDDPVDPFDVLIVEYEGGVLFQPDDPTLPGFQRIPAGEGEDRCETWKQLWMIQHGVPEVHKRVRSAIMEARLS